jgi:hypothetical protein
MIKRSGVLAALTGLFLAMVVVPALATPVSYSTQISWDGGAFATNNTVNLPGDGGTLKLTFAGVTNASANTGGSATLGTFTAGGFSWFSNAGGHRFDIRIVQNGPTPGTGDLLGTLRGGISWTGSYATANISGSASIGGIEYKVGGPLLLLPPPGSPADSPPGGVATLSAGLTENPEPGTLLLVGTGVAGLWGVARRRRQQRNRG